MADLPRFLPRRELGRTGFRVTRVGIGDLADRGLGLEACVATLRRALDAGLNLVDTAPAYEQGFSEEVVGRALHGRREGVFVIDKVDLLDQPVTKQVDESLARLGLPGVDLFAFHDVSDVAVWRRLAAKGGAFDELGECVRAGKARFRGVSSHHPEVLREALASGLCDVVLFPVGPFVDARYETEILPEARRRGVGTVCFKTFGGGMLVGDTAGYGRPLEDPSKAPLPRLSVRECVQYTLTLDPDVALLGLSTPTEQDAALEAAASAEPFDAATLESVRVRAVEAMAHKGRAWWNPAR